MPELQDKFLKPTENLRNLQLLEEIAKDSTVSQRKLSQRLGVALGVTNACLKKMVSKGLVKAQGINHKRIGYYLTPKGFSEKARLAYHFLQHTVSYYSALRDKVTASLNTLSTAGHKRIVCYGAGEVLEVVFIIINGSGFEFSILGITDDDENKHNNKMFGFVVQPPQIIKELRPDAVLVTSIRYNDEILHRLNNDKELSGISFYSMA